VSLSGDRALVGAVGDHTGAEDAGAAYVYLRSDTSWSEEAKLMARDPEPYDRLGCAVSLSDGVALLGARGLDDWWISDVGGAYVFHREGTSWTQEAKLEPSQASAGDLCGTSVALDGDTAVIGAPRDFELDVRRGSVHVFVRTPVASATFRNDSGGTNRPGFWAARPVLGEDWIAWVDNRGTGNFLAGILGYANPLELYLPRTGDYLLIDPLAPHGELLGLSPAYGYGIVMFTASIPDDPTLAGFVLSTQGAGLGGAGGTTLHNAYDLLLGPE